MNFISRAYMVGVGAFISAICFLLMKYFYAINLELITAPFIAIVLICYGDKLLTFSIHKVAQLFNKTE